MSLTACVLHTAYLDPQGYGKVRAGGRVALAHRVAWEAAHGPVAPELVLHHVCETKACVNVDHLVAVTQKQHMVLHTLSRSHCAHGHPFDAENTYVRLDGTGRQCRACKRARDARYYGKAT